MRTLSYQDRLEAFRIATEGFRRRYAGQIRAGMTDKELELALHQVLGLGGSGGPDRMDVWHQGGPGAGCTG